MLLLLTVALASCGSDEQSANPATDGGATTTQRERGDADAPRVKLAQCLREHGIDLPDDVGQGGAPPAGIDVEAVQQLLDGECKDLAASAFGDMTGGDEDFRDAFAVYAQCMRDAGVDLPDLPSDGGLPDTRAIDQDDPSFQAAQRACSDKLPRGLPGGGR